MLDVSRIDPWILLEDAQRPEHAREDVGLGPWLAGAVHRDLDGLVVGCHKDGMCVDRNGH